MAHKTDDISLSKRSKATNLYHLLTHFMSLVSSYTPYKNQRTSGSLMFSGGIERD